jgi:hypothetical protein
MYFQPVYTAIFDNSNVDTNVFTLLFGATTPVHAWVRIKTTYFPRKEGIVTTLGW